eukprot:TRINITY_DN724_c0_g1_i1.p1 TRINITY_DN724_c0_g1~~TRINITY_DN724_c0_g1_i1.p1  ORF type:complete len:113 (+),score=2.72 TRINITY_DN724_c0_g1_i1:55-393(+)
MVQISSVFALKQVIGNQKKTIDIRKSCSHHLTVTLGYTADKSGLPKTFKFLSGDHANRLIIFPQNYAEYAQEQTEKQEKEQAIIDAKNSKKERKSEENSESNTLYTINGRKI